jgi:uncharacterized membrane protein
MGAAVFSLLGIFVATYLYLYKIGRIGDLACGTGGCETVQQSPYAVFLGVEVALLGVIGYAGLLAVALIGLRPGLRDSPGPGLLLAVLSGVGVLFTAYLTYLELFVIHAICRWCVGSAVIITIVFVFSLADWRALRRSAEPLAPSSS